MACSPAIPTGRRTELHLRALASVNNWTKRVCTGLCSILEQSFLLFYIHLCVILVNYPATSRYRHSGSLSGPHIFGFSGVARDECVFLCLPSVCVSRLPRAAVVAWFRHSGPLPDSAATCLCHRNRHKQSQRGRDFRIR